MRVHIPIETSGVLVLHLSTEGTVLVKHLGLTYGHLYTFERVNVQRHCRNSGEGLFLDSDSEVFEVLSG